MGENYLILKVLPFFKSKSSFRTKIYFLFYLLSRIALKAIGKQNREIFLKKIFNIEVISNIEGSLFVHKVHEMIYQLPCLFEIYYGWPNKLIDHLKQSKIVVDVGAHAGAFSLFIYKKISSKIKIICIEPEPHNFDLLKRNIELNKIQKNKILLINKALWSKKVKLNFFVDAEGSGVHSLIKKTNKKIVIIADTLDNVIKNEKVDLVKIDVEGAEAEVLKGAKKTIEECHPKIIFEAWNESYLKKVKNVLRPFNYKIKKIDEQNYLAY